MTQRKAQIEPAIPLWVTNLVSFGVLIASLTTLVHLYATINIRAHYKALALAALSRIEPEQLPVNPFADADLEAKAAIVFDVQNEDIIFGHNEEMQLPLASLTKLMTAVTAMELLPEYTTISIPQNNADNNGLRPGSRYALKDLVGYSLVSSSNSASDSIAAAASAYLSGKGTVDTNGDSEDLFISAMNRTALRLGLSQTHFINSTGLDSSLTLGGAYGSARDIAMLLSYILKNHPGILTPTTMREIQLTSLDGNSFRARNTNAIVDTIPGLLGSKTGFTDLAGGNLVIAFDASFNEPFVIVVLGSSEKGRFSDIETLLTATITYLGTSSRHVTAIKQSW